MLTLEELHPPFGLTIACGPLAMTVVRDDDFPELVELVRGGIADPALKMPFLVAWHERPFDPGNPEAFPATSTGWWWTQRATCSPDRWQFALAVRREGELIGIQDIMTQNFPITRSVSTASWLGRPHQGQGFGTLMRQMVVGFAMDHLGALECHSGYVAGNAASEAVSRKVGYRPNGTRRIAHDGTTPAVEVMVRVTPEEFVRPTEPIRVEGAQALRRFLAVPDATT